VLWEPISDGPAWVSRHVMSVLCRLSARPHTGILLCRMSTEEDWLQWEGLQRTCTKVTDSRSWVIVEYTDIIWLQSLQLFCTFVQYTLKLIFYYNFCRVIENTCLCKFGRVISTLALTLVVFGFEYACHAGWILVESWKRKFIFLYEGHSIKKLQNSVIFVRVSQI